MKRCGSQYPYSIFFNQWFRGNEYVLKNNFIDFKICLGEDSFHYSPNNYQSQHENVSDSKRARP